MKHFNFFERHYLKLTGIIIFVLVVIVLLIALNRGFSIDEFEHVHTAWYIQQGDTPYRDFFQHHHPLLWYLVLPFLLVFGHSVKILLILRFVMFLLTLGIAVVVYFITKRLVLSNHFSLRQEQPVVGSTPGAAKPPGETNPSASGYIPGNEQLRLSKETGLMAVIFLLSTVLFTAFSIQIRPDVPQVLLGLLSFYYFIGFFREEKNRYMVLAGFFASISFLFLQKTLFLLIAYGLILLYKLLRRQVSFKPVLLFSVSFLLPFSLFLLYLFLSGSLNDYLLTNWLLNMNFARTDRFSLFRTLNYYILKDFFLWLFSVLCFCFIMKRRKETEPVVNLTAFTGFVLLVTLFLIKRPWGHNFLFPLTMPAILSAYYLQHLFLKYRLKKAYRVLVLVLVVLSSAYFLLQRCENQNRHKLERADYVIQNSQEDEAVYDGKNLFNLFRPDLHYFWFSLKPSHGLDTYNRLTGDKYGDYDICRLIKLKKPKFISDFGIDMKRCGLDKLYRKIPHENLYIRID